MKCNNQPNVGVGWQGSGRWWDGGGGGVDRCSIGGGVGGDIWPCRRKSELAMVTVREGDRMALPKL